MTSTLDDDPLLKPVQAVEGWKVLPPVVLYAKIGQGGMGAVYRGRHLEFDLDVAVKCLKPSLAAEDEQFIARFRREARLAANLTHENLVRVYEYRRAFGLHYLVMEFIDGETARERVVRKGRLSEHESAAILLGAARGLSKAHRNDEVIIHRDVKPDNIMISRRGEVKLADLGIAKAMQHDEGVTLNTAGVIGTPQYMAPEQWERDQAMGPQSDVWSLGATLYYLLTGESGIRAGSEKQVYVDVCQKAFPDVRARRPEVSSRLVAILDRCMQKDMTLRYEDAGALADALAEFIGRESPSLIDQATGSARTVPLISPPPSPTMKRIRTHVETPGESSATPPPARTIVYRRSKPIAWWTGGGAAVLAIVLGLFYGLNSWFRGPEPLTDKASPVLKLESPPALAEFVPDSTQFISLDFDEELISARANGKDATKIEGRNAEFELQVPKAEKTFDFDYMVTDLAGNHTSGKLQYRSRANPKPLPPRILLYEPDRPDDEAYVAAENLVIRGLVENVTDAKLKLLVEGKSSEPNLESTGRFRIDQPIPPDRRTKIRLEYDRESKEFTAIQDSMDPKLTVVSPIGEAAYTNEETADIVVRAVDLNLAEVLLDGRPMTAVGDGSYKAKDVRLIREGDNTFEVVATDKALRAPKALVVITRDQSKPKLTERSPPEYAEFEPGSIARIHLSFDEPMSSVIVDGKPATKIDGATADLVLTVPAGEGRWEPKYEALDRAKNVQTGTLKYERKNKAAPLPPVIRMSGLSLENGKLYLKETSLPLRGSIDNPTDAKLELTVGDKKTPIDLRGSELSAGVSLPRDQTSKVELKYGQAAPYTFEVIQDSKDPKITPVAPASDSMITNLKKVNLLVRVDEDHLKSVMVGEHDMKDAGNSTWRTEEIDLEDEGENTIQVTATDKALRTAGLTFTITRDTKLPRLGRESEPKEGAEFEPGTKFQARLVFDEAIARVAIGGQDYPATGREVIFSVDVPSGTGTWPLKGVALDLAGNAGPFELRLGRAAGASHSAASDGPLPEGWEVIDPNMGAGGKWPRKVQHRESGIRFVIIEAGQFDMGAPSGEPGSEADEELHRVIISRPFYMAETETTQLQYRTIALKSPSASKGDQKPVEKVTWREASQFCEAIGCALPTEAQWEYACRAGSGSAYSTGATLTKAQANHNGKSPYDIVRDGKGPNTMKVGLFPANDWGLSDMHGNVAEWCRDGYAPYPKTSPVTDPVGSGSKLFVIRGGGWMQEMVDCRSANRDKWGPNEQDQNTGFRCIMNLP